MFTGMTIVVTIPGRAELLLEHLFRITGGAGSSERF